MMKVSLLLLFVCLSVAEDVPCRPKSFGFDSFVCVCDSRSCDTIEHVSGPPNEGYLHVASNKRELRFHKEEGPVSQHSLEKRFFGGTTLSVNSSLKYQSIVGFGAAFTDAAGINVRKLSMAARERLMKSYFSSEGIEYSLGRVPIGGTDYSLYPYTYDDNSPDDVSLKDFALKEFDHDFKIPDLREALRLREKVDDGNSLWLYGSPWSAPAWMKTNNEIDKGGFLKSEYFETYANYFVKFLEEYHKRDVPFWGVTTQNEPLAALLPDYQWNCMGWLPWQEGAWVRDYLGPALKNSSFPDIAIISMDEQRWALPLWGEFLFNNPSMAQWYKGVGIHWYWDDMIPPQVLSHFYENHPDLFILYTEGCIDKPIQLGDWKRAEKYAQNILEDLTHGVSGFTDWNFALSSHTGGPSWANDGDEAPIMVNGLQDEFYKQTSFYAIGHFSKFIPRNSRRVEMTSNHRRTSLQYGAFQTPSGHTVAVILNFSNEKETVTIEDETGRHFQVTLTEDSLNTILW